MKNRQSVERLFYYRHVRNGYLIMHEGSDANGKNGLSAPSFRRYGLGKKAVGSVGIVLNGIDVALR
jgi:hypothetical protein